jgi:hypothetical protein
MEAPQLERTVGLAAEDKTGKLAAMEIPHQSHQAKD